MMKHIKKLRFLLPLLAICLLIAGATPASAADYDFLSSSSDAGITVKTNGTYTVIDGVKEADVTLTKTGGATVKAHVLLVKPWAKASFKPIVPGYYTEGSTKATRTEKAESWKDSDWRQLGVTNMIKEYNSAADTADEPVIAAINGAFSQGSGAPRGPLIIEGNWMQYSAIAEDEFLFGTKDNGAINIVQRISAQNELYTSAICGSAYILRNGSLFGVDAENDARQRTGIAYRTNGDVLLITVESGISVKQLAQLMRDSGCWNGVNMDGGGSITFITDRSDENGGLVRRTPDVADSYADKDENGERKICSALMLVADEDAVANNVGDTSKNSVTSDKDTYLQGEAINVTATTNSDGAWVGLIDANDTSAKPGSKFWYYVYGANGAGTWGWENGATYDICTDGNSEVGGYSSALLNPGEYKLAVINYAADGSDSYDILASKNITIEYNPDLVMDDYTLRTDKDVYEVGEPIMTTMTAPMTDGTAWVGITEHGHVAAGDNATYYWYYNSGSNAGISHTNGFTYNLLEQEQIGDVDINDANVNASLIDRENRKLLPGTYDIIVYPSDGYTPAEDKDGNVVKKTITIVDTKAVYTITYKDGEKDITGLTPATYTFLEAQDGSIALPAIAEKTGHEFAGWYEKADFSGSAVTSIAQGSNGNKTFYAKFNPIKYDVTFDTDGGTSIEVQKVAYGTKATMPADPEKEGFMFMGWITAEGATFNFEEPITGTTTIYANWEKIDDGKRFVTFNTTGGSVINPVAVMIGEKVARPADPTREGYTFDKWVTREGGYTAFNFDKAIEEDTTAYASWKAVKYTVTYNTDGGQAVANGTFTVESEIAELPVTTKDGYKFLGWKDADGNTVTKIAKGTIGNITLTAQWQREAFLSLNKTTFVEGEAINVTAYCENEGSWIGLYKEGDTVGSDLSYYWDYVANHNGQEFNLLQYKSADNSNPLEIGNYRVILFADGGYTELFSETITIIESNNPAQGKLIVSGASRDDKEYGGVGHNLHGTTLYEFCYGDAINVQATVSGDGTDNAWVCVVNDVDYNNGVTNAHIGKNWFYVADYAGQTVNLNYVNDNVMSADAEPLAPYGLNYWIALVSDSGKILDGVPLNHRTFNVDWYENISTWGAAVRDSIVVEMDWTSAVENGENQMPKVVIKHKGHFGLEEVDGELVEITERTLIEGHDYTLTYPKESKEVGAYSIKVDFPIDQPVDKIDYYDYLSAKQRTNPEFYGFKDGIAYYITATANDHVIKYELNGGKNDPANPEVYQTGTKITLQAPTRVGYSFAGWYTTPGFQEGTQIDEIAADSTADYTLYAKWISEAKASYKITYVLNGGDNPVANPTGYTGEADLTLLAPTKNGYKFEGWFFDAAFTKPAAITKGMSGDVTLYAKFTKEKAETFTIYTDVRYGSISDNETVTEGASHTVTYKANSGYVLVSVTVDGEEVDITKYPTSYTFENVTANHEISVVFKKAPAKVTMKSIATGNKQVTVAWNEVEDADEYNVYRSTDNVTFELIKTTTALKYTDATVKGGVKYYYAVAAVKNDVVGEKSTAKSVTASKVLGTAKIKSIVAQNGKVTVKWNKVANATAYKVYRSANGGKTYTLVTTTKKLSFTTGTVQAAKAYKYKIQAVQNGFAGKMSAVKNVTVLAKVQNFKVTSNKNKTVTLKWNKVKNAKKYVVFKSTNGGKTFKKVLTTNKNTAKFKNLKKGSKIQYKVRAINGNNYGKFSVVRKVTVK